MFDEVRRIYDQSLKPRDRRSNVLFFRVLAAPLVLVFARLGLTPNQVTLAGLIPMAVGLYCWVEMPGSMGLWLGLLGIELAYILDCVDGQLARYTDQTSPVGAELDFMMDEIKALALVCAGWFRLHKAGETDALLWASLTLLALAIAFALTRFIRHPIYVEAVGGTQPKHGQVAPAAPGALGLAETVFKTIAFYPESLLLMLVMGLFLNWPMNEGLVIFLTLYAAVHFIYVGKTGTSIGLKLGRRGASLTDGDSHS